MSNTNLFTSATFNTNLLPENAVVFDANGIIRDGGITNPGQLGYTAANMDAYIEGSFANSPYAGVVTDVSAQFPDATYYYGINSAVTVVDSQGGYTTTHYIDNGIKGTKDSDVVLDHAGDNIVNTLAGDDLVMLGGGNDAVNAGSGNDVVFSGAGDDIVKAGSGSDTVYLGDGNDHAQGNGGNDAMFGEGGDDCIDGGGGRDTLDGGAGNDELTGGRGKDVFIFATGYATDTITDMESRDTIELDMGLGVANFNDLSGLAAQSGQDLVFTFAGGDQLILEDTTMADLSASNFDFV